MTFILRSATALTTCTVLSVSLSNCSSPAGDIGATAENGSAAVTPEPLATVDGATVSVHTLNPVSGSNNQVQINKAVAAGGVVHLNPGTYVISDTIKMTSGSTLEGAAGAILKLESNAGWPKFKAMVEGHGVSGVHISGFEIDGSGESNTSSNGASTVCGKYYYTMLYFTDSSHVEVDHMNLRDNWNDIFKFSTSSNVRFHDNTVRKEGHDVVYAIHSHDVWVYRNDIKIACNSGVRPDGTKNIYVFDNEITRDGGGYAGIEIQGASEVWMCNNNIHGLLGPAVANLSGAPVHTTGCHE